MARPVLDPQKTLSVIRDQAIDALVGIPVQVLSLVRAEAAIRDPIPRVRSVLLTTDHVPGAVRRAIESAWPCRVFNHYGMTEMGLGGGVDCEAREGYHLRRRTSLSRSWTRKPGGPCPCGIILRQLSRVRTWVEGRRKTEC